MLEKEIVQYFREKIGPIAKPKKLYFVDELPKTRSGKIMRRILRKIYLGEELGDISTLVNINVVEIIKLSLK